MQTLQNPGISLPSGLNPPPLLGRMRVLGRQRVKKSACIRSPAQLLVSGQQYGEIVTQLAERALCAASTLPPGGKHVVGIAGAPGSGKSTLANEVMTEVNRLAGASIAVVLPMDGFHYYRAELDAMPDPQAAHARRGAPFTFDAKIFLACVRRVKADGQASAPSFDHGAGDPKPDGIQILPSHKVVFVEGNYVLLLEEPWGQLQTQGLLDDRVFVDTDLDECAARIFRRQTGHGNTPEQSRRRICGNDRPNGELVRTTRVHADVIVPNVPIDQ